MDRPPVLVAPPTALPLPLDTFKQWLGESAVPSDALLTAYLETATAGLDGYAGRLGRAIINQDWQQDFDGAGQCFRLRLPDVSAASVSYLGAGGIMHEASSDSFRIGRDQIGWFLSAERGAHWATVRGVASVRVTYTAGFGAAGDAVPAPIRTAIFHITRAMCFQPTGDGDVRSEMVEGVGSTGFVSPVDVARVNDDTITGLLRKYRWRSL